MTLPRRPSGRCFYCPGWAALAVLTTAIVMTSSPLLIPPVPFHSPADASNLSGRTLDESGTSGRDVRAASGLYTITFREVGLPTASQWAVAMNGTALYSTTPSVEFVNLANGTYAFGIGPPEGYFAAPATGTITITNRTVQRTIDFFSLAGAPVYQVTFVESGLPSGTAWSVTLGTSTLVTTNASLTVEEINGSYDFGIPTVLSYSASPSSGTITVSGAAVSQVVSFSAPKVLGLSPAEGFFVISVGLLVGVVFLALLGLILWRHRRQVVRGAMSDLAHSTPTGEPDPPPPPPPGSGA